MAEETRLSRVSNTSGREGTTMILIKRMRRKEGSKGKGRDGVNKKGGRKGITKGKGRMG